MTNWEYFEAADRFERVLEATGITKALEVSPPCARGAVCSRVILLVCGFLLPGMVRTGGPRRGIW